MPSQQYQQQTDLPSAFMQQPGLMGPPLQPLQQQQSYAATFQRPVLPKTVLINSKFNQQKQHQSQERQQSIPVDRVSQQRVRGRTDRRRSRGRESNPRKGAILHQLDELDQVIMLGMAVVKHIPGAFLSLDQ